MQPIDDMDQLNYATSYDQYFHQDLMNSGTPEEFSPSFDANWDVVTSPSPTSYNLILSTNSPDRNTHIVPNVMYDQTEWQLDQSNFVLENSSQFNDSGSSDFAVFCHSNDPFTSKSVQVEQAPSSFNIPNLDSHNMYLPPDVSQQFKLPSIETLRQFMPSMRRYQYPNDSAPIAPTPETTSDSPKPESLVPPAIHTARVKKQRNYKCTTCNGYFYKKSHLKRHYQTKVHKEEVVFSGKPDPAASLIDLRIVPRPHKCTTCKKGFITKSILKTHYKAATHKDKVKISGKADPATLVTDLRSKRSNRKKQANLSDSSQETPSSSESQTAPMIQSNDFPVDEGSTARSSVIIQPNEVEDLRNFFQATVSPSTLESSYFSNLTPVDEPKGDFSQATDFAKVSETQSQSNHFSHLTTIDGPCTAVLSVIIYQNEQADLNSFSQATDFSNGSETHLPPTLQSSDFSYMIPFEPSTARSSGLIYPNEQAVPSDYTPATVSSYKTANQFQELTTSKKLKRKGSREPSSVSTSSRSISTIKRKESIFYCIPCDRKFEKSCYFVQHNNAIHSEKPHKCSKCGKRFKLLIERDEHEAKHVGIKPFQCGSCTKQFNYRSDLRKHEFSHTGQMPHVCEICKQGFIRKAALIKHQSRCEMNDNKKHNSCIGRPTIENAILNI